jgi:hypothetical protein
MRPPQRMARPGTGRCPATIAQRHRIAELAEQAGVEQPAVVWYAQAEKVIALLEQYLRQPTLDGMERVR